MIINLLDLVWLMTNAVPHYRSTGVDDDVPADDILVIQITAVLTRWVVTDADVVLYKTIESFPQLVTASEAKVVIHLIVRGAVVQIDAP